MKKFLAFFVVAMAICASAFAAPANKEEAYQSFAAVRDSVMSPIVASYTGGNAGTISIFHVKGDATTPDKWFKTSCTVPEAFITVFELDNENNPYSAVLEIQRNIAIYPSRNSAALAQKQDTIVQTTNEKYKYFYNYVNDQWVEVGAKGLINKDGSKWEEMSTVDKDAVKALTFRQPADPVA
jgi:opacity protein-like surface antigen